MKFSLFSVAAVSLGAVNAAPKGLERRQDGVPGFDISNWQESVDFAGAYDSGARFVMIKASEGTSYVDPSFNSHYTGATDAGLIRGGYHFALPDSGSAAAQAEHFIENGGGWTSDGITLPGMLDIETNPYGDSCYGMSASAMVSWIQEFVDTYQSSTGAYPLIYTSPGWWEPCTGDSSAFTETCPLVLARWADSPGTSPGGWPTHTFWQFNDAYEYGGDSQMFNGDMEGLEKIATG